MRIIAGDARGRRIEAPEGRDTRPTLDRVRENLFNMLQGEIAGSRVLDLFAGSGALSFEALSRGAETACLADHDRKSAVLCDRHSLDVIVVDFLIVFCVDLDPPAVAAAHGIRMVVVDVDRSGQGPVHDSHDDGQPAGGCYIQEFPHIGQTRG